LAKAGPKGKPHSCKDGTVYPELRRRPSGRFYINRYPLKHKELNTCDEKEAIKKLLIWKGEQDNKWVKGKQLEDRYKIKTGITHDDNGEKIEYKDSNPEIHRAHEIPEDHLIDIFVEWITNRPKWLAHRTGIEELAYLDGLQKPEVLSLDRVAKIYRSKKISVDEMTSTMNAWKEFTSAAEVSSISQIGTDEIQKYADYIHSRKFAAKTFRNRLNKVITLLNYAKPRHKAHAKKIEEIKLDLKHIIQLPKSPAPDPRPLRPAHFKAILEAALPQFKAVLMLSLNCALHPKELSEVLEEELDLEYNSFITKRTKTNIARCAYLWRETMKAIKPYFDDRKFLFYQGNGNPHNRHSLAREWTRTAKRAKVKGYSFDSLRDSCRTAMAGHGEKAAFVMGHTFAMSDKYTYRDSDATKIALEVVRQKYLK